MAGTLVIDTIKSSTTNPPTVQNTNGTEIGTFCRAWVNFNGTTSPATIRASFNVSSVTRNGTGDYTVNFINAMPDTNFCTQVTLGSTGVSTTTLRQLYMGTISSQRFLNATTGGTGVDADNIQVAVFR